MSLLDAQPQVWKYNPLLANYNFFDFGVTDPWVCLDVQTYLCGKEVTIKTAGKEPEVKTCGERVFVGWREYYRRGMTTGEHIANLRNRSNPPGYAVQVGFGDCASPGDVMALGKDWCPMLAMPESKTPEMFKLGVQGIQGLLRPTPCKGPHLFLDPCCENTAWEFENYRWPKQTDAEQSINESKPDKRADHAMDAWRYGYVHLNVLGMQYHLDEVYRPSDFEHSSDAESFDLLGVERDETFFSLNRGGPW